MNADQIEQFLNEKINPYKNKVYKLQQKSEQQNEIIKQYLEKIHILKNKIELNKKKNQENQGNGDQVETDQENSNEEQQQKFMTPPKKIQQNKNDQNLQNNDMVDFIKNECKLYLLDKEITSNGITLQEILQSYSQKLENDIQKLNKLSVYFKPGLSKENNVEEAEEESKQEIINQQNYQELDEETIQFGQNYEKERDSFKDLYFLNNQQCQEHLKRFTINDIQQINSLETKPSKIYDCIQIILRLQPEWEIWKQRSQDTERYMKDLEDVNIQELDFRQIYHLKKLLKEQESEGGVHNNHSNYDDQGYSKFMHEWINIVIETSESFNNLIVGVSESNIYEIISQKLEQFKDIQTKIINIIQ